MSAEYRYGFGGQEQDNELYGHGNSYTAEFWQYDTRLGRRWNVDPVRVAWESGYAVFRNSPLLFSDPSGATPECSGCPKDAEKGESRITKNNDGTNSLWTYNGERWENSILLNSVDVVDTDPLGLGGRRLDPTGLGGSRVFRMAFRNNPTQSLRGIRYGEGLSGEALERHEEFMRGVNYMAYSLYIPLAALTAEIVLPSLLTQSSATAVQNATVWTGRTLARTFYQGLSREQMLINVIGNTGGQYVANGFDYNKIDILDVGLSALGGWGANLTASTVDITNDKFRINNPKDIMINFTVNLLADRVNALPIVPSGALSPTQSVYFRSVAETGKQSVANGLQKSISENEK